MENIVTIFGSCFRKVSCFVCSLLQSIVPFGLFDRTMTEFEVKLLIRVGLWDKYYFVWAKNYWGAAAD